MIVRIMLLSLAALAIAAAPTKSASKRDELSALTTQLQKTPTDDALREKLLKAATKLKTKPATPVEARRHFVKGVTLQKDAKDSSELVPAIAEYRLALVEAKQSGKGHQRDMVEVDLDHFARGRTPLAVFCPD